MSVARSPETATELQDLSARLSQLEREVASLGERVALLDGDTAPSPAQPHTSSNPPAIVTRERWLRVVTHVGRAVIALGGAYLLRAFTETSVIAPSTGIWLGLTYALAWSAVSIRVARRGDPLAAWFSALLTPVLALALVVEATLRFEFWAPMQGFAVLAMAIATAIAVAVVNRQQSLAWMATAGGTLVALGLMASTREYVAAEILFIALGVTTLWLGYVCDWTLLRWPTALVADLVAVAMVVRAATPAAGESPTTVLGVLLLLLVAYSGSIIVRTTVLNRSVVVFEVVQAAALLLLLRGVLALAPGGSARWSVAVVLLVLGTATLATAIAFAGRHRSASVNVHFYTALGVVVMLVGFAVLFDGDSLAFAWLGLALAITGAARLMRVDALLAYAVGITLAATVPSGLLRDVVRLLISSAGADPTAVQAAVCWSLAGLAWLVTLSHARREDILLRGAASVGAAAFIVSVAVLAVAPVIAWGGRESTTGTVALSSAACAAAAVARWKNLPALFWIAYALLSVTALKLAADNLHGDGALALFVALAVYGASLMTTARLVRARS